MAPAVLALLATFVCAASPGGEPSAAVSSADGTTPHRASPADEPLEISPDIEDETARAPPAVEGRPLDERALQAAVTGVSAAGTTLAVAAAVFSATIAFATFVPLLVQLVLLPFFPFTLLVPPLAAALAAILAAWPTTDWLGLTIIGGVTVTAALASFVVAFALTGPVLLGAFSDERLAPGRGAFEAAILAHVLLPPLVVGLAASVSSAVVNGGVLDVPSSE